MRIAAHQAIQAMEEETAQIGRRRELADLLDIALPAQQRSGAQGAVFGAVIDVFDPDPETVVQLFERERVFGIEVGEELIAYGAKAALDLAAALGLIGTRVNDQSAERGGDARQLRRAIDLGVVDVQANGHAAAAMAWRRQSSEASSPWLG